MVEKTNLIKKIKIKRNVKNRKTFVKIHVWNVLAKLRKLEFEETNLKLKSIT